MAVSDTVIVWLLAFAIIYWLLCRQKIVIWRFIGYIFLFINALIGVIIEDSLITFIVLGVTMVLLVKETIETLQHWGKMEEKINF